MTYYEFKHNISKIYQNELCHTIQYHNQITKSPNVTAAPPLIVKNAPKKNQIKSHLYYIFISTNKDFFPPPKLQS